MQKELSNLSQATGDHSLMTSIINWIIELGVRAGPLRLGAPLNEVLAVSAYEDPYAVRDEAASVDDYAEMLAAIGPDFGLDPGEFEDMLGAMKAEAQGETRIVPRNAADPVLFLRDGVLAEIIFSPRATPILDGRNVFDLSAVNLIRLLFDSSDVAFTRSNEVVFPELSVRLVDFVQKQTKQNERFDPDESNSSTRLFILEKNEADALRADRYRALKRPLIE